MSLNSDLTAIKNIQDGVKNNKVTRFAYTQTAYTNNDVNGHDDYVATRDNNIPLSDLSVIEVNQTVVDKGFRARASALNRMFLNHLFGRVSYNLNKINDLFNELLVKLMANLGVADGLATLDSTGRIPYSQLPEDAMEYQGDWDASTNTPTLVDGTGTKGDTYNVSVAGDQTFGGVSVHFFVGDRVIYNGSIWQRFESGAVQSVCEILPDPVTANVDLSKQTDITKIFNSNFLDTLLINYWYRLWKKGTVSAPAVMESGTPTSADSGVVKGNGVYVAYIGRSIFSSVDGKAWVGRFTVGNNIIKKLIYVPNAQGSTGVFVLSATASSSDTFGLYISTDGINWSGVQALAGKSVEGIGGDSAHLVASTMSYSHSSDGLYESFDGGLTWSRNTNVSSSYGGGIWDFATQSGQIWGVGDNRLVWYYNSRWNTGIFNGSTGQCIRADMNKVVIGTRSNGIYVNTDNIGLDFNQQVLGGSSGFNCYKIFSDGEMFVTQAEGIAYYSRNGTSWYPASGLSTSGSIRSFARTRNMWLASGGGEPVVFISKDGMKWETIAIGYSTYGVGAIDDADDTACIILPFAVSRPDMFARYSGKQEMLEYFNGE